MQKRIVHFEGLVVFVAAIYNDWFNMDSAYWNGSNVWIWIEI